MDFLMNLAQSHLNVIKKFLKEHDPKKLHYSIKKDSYLNMWMLFCDDRDLGNKVKMEFDKNFRKGK